MKNPDMPCNEKWGIAPIGPRTIWIDECVLESANCGDYVPKTHDEEIEFCKREAERLFELSDISEQLRNDFLEWISVMRWHVYSLFKDVGVGSVREVMDTSLTSGGMQRPAIEFHLRDVGAVKFVACHLLNGKSDGRPSFVESAPHSQNTLRELMGRIELIC